MPNTVYLPSEILKPFIQCYIISESAEESAYKVLPETGVVIGFQFRGRLSYLEQGNEIKLAPAGITGIRDTWRVFKSSQNVGSVLVKFREGAAASFFEEPIHELFGESMALNSLIKPFDLALLEEQLYEAATHKKKINVIEKFLLYHKRDVPTDALVRKAIENIYTRNGHIKIKELTADLNISQSPLEKRFRKVVGTSPKTFASIVRLKHTISVYNPSTSLSELGYNAGFFDQAHFIKAFVKFSGETPQSYFRIK